MPTVWLARWRERKAAMLAPKWSEHVGVTVPAGRCPDATIDTIAEFGFGWLGVHVDIGTPAWSHNAARIADRAQKHGLRLFVTARPAHGDYPGPMLEAFGAGCLALADMGADAFGVCPLWNLPGMCDPWFDDGTTPVGFMRTSIGQLRRKHPDLPLFLGPVDMDPPDPRNIADPSRSAQAALDAVLPELAAFANLPDGLAYRSGTWDALPALPTGDPRYIAELWGPHPADALATQAVFVRAGYPHLAHLIVDWRPDRDRDTLHTWLNEPYPAP